MLAAGARRPSSTDGAHRSSRAQPAFSQLAPVRACAWRACSVAKVPGSVCRFGEHHAPCLSCRRQFEVVTYHTSTNGAHHTSGAGPAFSQLALITACAWRAYCGTELPGSLQDTQIPSASLGTPRYRASHQRTDGAHRSSMAVMSVLLLLAARVYQGLHMACLLGGIEVPSRKPALFAGRRPQSNWKTLLAQWWRGSVDFRAINPSRPAGRAKCCLVDGECCMHCEAS